MKQLMIVRLNTLVMVAVLLAFASCSIAGTAYWYTPQYISDISGHTACEAGSPYDTTTLYAYGLGTNALSTPISWPVVDFTGLSVPSPNYQYQRGINDAWYGATAGQAYAYGMGFQVHSESGSNPNPVGNIRGMILDYRWSNYTNLKPWAGYGANAYFRIQTYFAIQDRAVSSSSVVQYGQMVAGLVDVVHNKAIWYSVSLWDSRGIQPEFVIRDTGGTTNFNVGTHLKAGTRYCSPEVGSQLSDGTGSGLWYAAKISRQNLINAVNDINRAYGAGLSTNPDNYALCEINAGPEEYVPSGEIGWIGARIDQVWAVTIY